MACTSQLTSSLSLPTVLPRTKPLRCIDPATTTSAEELAALGTSAEIIAAVWPQAMVGKKLVGKKLVPKFSSPPRVLCRMNTGTRVYITLPQRGWEITLAKAVKNVEGNPKFAFNDFILLPVSLELKRALPPKGLALDSRRHCHATATLIDILRRALEFCVLQRVAYRDMLPILVKAFRASRTGYSDKEFFVRVADVFNMTKDDIRYDLAVLAIKATHEPELVAGRVYGNFKAGSREERKYWSDTFLNDLNTCFQAS